MIIHLINSDNVGCSVAVTSHCGGLGSCGACTRGLSLLIHLTETSHCFSETRPSEQRGPLQSKLVLCVVQGRILVRWEILPILCWKFSNDQNSRFCCCHCQIHNNSICVSSTCVKCVEFLQHVTI